MSMEVSMKNSPSVDKRKNITSIDIMRVVCAYMVVAIHLYPAGEVIFSPEYFFTQIITKIAVPFFFVVSGYFFIKSLIKGKNIVGKYLKRLIFTYTVWSILYVTLKLVIHNGNILEWSNVKSILLSYFLYGTWEHLWYFPALICCVAICSICSKLKLLNKLAFSSIILYTVGVLGCAYYKIGNEIPILSLLYNSEHFTLIRRIFLMGLPFFMMGYYLNKISCWIQKQNNKIVISSFIILTICFLAEIYIGTKFNMQRSTVITIFLYPLVGTIMVACFKNPLNKFEKYTNYFRGISNFTYYAHPLIFIIINIVFGKIIGIALLQLEIFGVTCMMTSIIAVIIYKFNIRFLIKFIN